MAGAIAVVLAFGAQRKAVEPVCGANRMKAVAAASENLVDVGLVADVPDEFVFR